MDDGGLAKGQHSSHLWLPEHIHLQLRRLAMQRGLARGAWSHSERDSFIFQVQFWEWEMSNRQTSATAGKTRTSTEEKNDPGQPGLQGPEELETWRWYLTLRPVARKTSSCPRGGIWNPLALLGTVSQGSCFQHLP